MRVYNVNKAIGLASSGVEYAQRYRRQLLDGIDWVEDHYVFTDYLPTNLHVFAERLGFVDTQVHWVYDLVTGRETRPPALSVDAFLATIEQPHAPPRRHPDHLEVALTDSAVRYRIRTTGSGLVDRVETVVGGRLTRVAHYDATLHHVEHLHDGKVVRRVFHTPDGRVGAEQLVRDREIVRTLVTPASPLYDRSVPPRRGAPSSFGGELVLEGRSGFLRFVFEHLLDRPDDVVIVDRALDVIDAIYPVIGERRLYSVVHAEHYDLRRIEDGVLLWNNHYEHVFTRPDLVDGLIVSTHRQREVLQAQLAARFPDRDHLVARIPVGFVDAPAAGRAVDRHALVTASRLADEKHLDVLIRAVALAREALPELRLDIYGEGKREPLLAVIRETGTEDRVRLLGHQRLDGVLGGYGLYVSASTSEGFGLSLLEAMAEGVPVVGFDVEYGNRELVESGANGRLVPFTRSDRDVVAFAEAIVAVLSSDSLEDMRRESLRRAEAYTAAKVRRLWERLLSGEAPC